MRKSIIDVIDNAPKYLPRTLQSSLRPLQPVYEAARERIYGAWPDRVRRTPWGPKIVVDYSQYVEKALAEGTYEKDVIAQFSKECQKGYDHFADIGSNIGFYSLLFAHVTEDTKRVDAYEPIPFNGARLLENVRLNGYQSINIHSFALAESRGQAEMQINESALGESTLGKRMYSQPARQHVQTTTETIDGVYGVENGPDIMKIDVEGAEIRVFRGGQKTIRAHTPELFVEYHPRLVREMGGSVEELVKLLDEAGYQRFYHVQSGEQKSLEALTELSTDESQNVHISTDE